MSSDNRTLLKISPVMPDLEACIQPYFDSILNRYGFSGGIMAYKNSNNTTYEAICSFEVPLAPFNGSAKGSLTAILLDCHLRHPIPHVHSLKAKNFWKELSSVCNTEDWQKRGLFIPFVIDNDSFDFLIFSKDNTKLKVAREVILELQTITANAAAIMRSSAIEQDLKVTEHYVKELGHDLASSVQAIISKIRNVRKGQVTGPLVTKKLEEAEGEIMSIYRSSDSMGITVDPHYNIRDGNDFDIRDVINTVITLCESEAEERHITIEPEMDNNDPVMWGDRKAIESALMHLLMNAIKYSRGSSKIHIRCKADENDRVHVSVVNFGISIDEDFRSDMWEFGKRGREALEMHTNGSGIGLFTVRKIIRAHAGTVNHRATGENKKCNTFSFTIPKREVLTKMEFLR